SHRHSAGSILSHFVCLCAFCGSQRFPLFVHVLALSSVNLLEKLRLLKRHGSCRTGCRDRSDTEENERNDEPTQTEVFNFRCRNFGPELARGSRCTVWTLSPGSLSGRSRLWTLRRSRTARLSQAIG